MKLKNLVMLAAALTCIAGSTVMAEEKVASRAPVLTAMKSSRS